MNSSAPSPRKVSRRAKPGIVALQFILVSVLLIVIWFSWRANVSPSSGAPHRWGNLELASLIASGQQAIDQIEALHQTGIKLVDGYIARYARGNDTAEVWVGIAESGAAASALVQQMTEAIGKGNSPFSIPQQITVDEQKVFTVNGQGKTHYYYSSGSKTVWLSISSSNPISLVQQALKTF